jgi:hypothetical protein
VADTLLAPATTPRADNRKTAAPGASDPLARWRHDVTISPVSGVGQRHTMHAYYTASPEHPDGSRVLLYASSTREGHAGDLYVVDRATGRETALVRGLAVEDTHRAACQQWVSGGRRIAYHDVRGGEWLVACTDAEDGTERILARGRQLGWGQPDADLVPLYGPHWAPGPHRDLSLLDVATGDIRTALAADAVRETYPDLVAKEFGDRPISIFFPALSPDLTRVFFKIATPLGGDFRSTTASHRALLICYDLAAGRFLFADERWGHPAWHPDSRTIVDVPNVLIDSDSGARRTLADLPALPGAHPSFSPRGDLCVSDVALERMGGAKGERGVVVQDLNAQEHVLIHRFDDSRGAASWRRCHPHPVFSPNGERLYFAASTTEWTQLFVAEPSALGAH